MIITKRALARRTVLRGLGATLALPLLDGMVPALTALSQTAAKPVRRFGVVYLPNGVVIDQWTPALDGTQYALSPILQPLTPFQNRLVVLSGLSQNTNGLTARSGAVHGRCATKFLTGAIPRPFGQEGNDFRADISIDQLIARELGQDTQLGSLELSLESGDKGAGTCDGGYSCTYSHTIAWRGPTTPLPMEHNPRVVFERLFGEGGTAAQRLQRLGEDRSILDAVTDEIARLEQTLGAGDRNRVGQYLDAVREIERRIQRAEVQAGESTLPPTLDRPVGIPESFDEHAKLMYDLQALAFQADITRVFTFLIGREQTNQSYPEIGVPDPHHSMSHHGHDPEKLAKYAKIGTYHIQLLSYFLDKLRAIPDGDGNVLDNSMILFGSGISDGDQHSHVDLPLVLAGGAMGMKQGKHLRYPAYTPMANLFVNMLDRMGVPQETVGDSTGTLELEPLSGV